MESLTARFHQCARLSPEKGEGARQLIEILRDIGGTILDISYGDIHENIEGDIDETGSIIVQPGLRHPLLKADPDPLRRRQPPSASFAYIDPSRTFRYSQYADSITSDQADSVTQGQLALGRVVYQALRPLYGWIDESGENEPSQRRIKNLELTCLFWANFFGPKYVERYGRDFLMNAPGWKKEELDDGGILYVVDESYIRWHDEPAREAIDYFKTAVPAIRQYRSRGFERTERLMSDPPKKRRKRKNP